MGNAWDSLYPFYSGRSSGHDPWSSISKRKELDLRREMKRLLYGAADEIPKGRNGLLRRMERNSDGSLKKCDCRDTITDEPDKDFYCPYCLGMGFYWKEEVLTYFKTDESNKTGNSPFSESGFNKYFIYLEYFIQPTDDDYIVEVKLDTEGKVVFPVERHNIYRIEKSESYRSDYGRIEYYRCRCTLERKWSVYYGVPSRQHNPSS